MGQAAEHHVAHGAELVAHRGVEHGVAVAVDGAHHDDMPSTSSRPSASRSRTPCADSTGSGAGRRASAAYGCHTWARSAASRSSTSFTQQERFEASSSPAAADGEQHHRLVADVVQHPQVDPREPEHRAAGETPPAARRTLQLDVAPLDHHERVAPLGVAGRPRLPRAEHDRAAPEPRPVARAGAGPSRRDTSHPSPRAATTPEFCAPDAGSHRRGGSADASHDGFSSVTGLR